jgi:hypothetical protein
LGSGQAIWVYAIFNLLCPYTMRNKISLFACLIMGLILFAYRLNYPGLQSKEPLKITTWDAYGYYMHLPAMLIYKDVKQLSFHDSIDHKYQLSGGNFYQANKHEKTGNYVFKYLGGLAILHLPLFTIAHIYALNSAFPADGFSAPYQHAIGFGVVLYAILALFILRKVLLTYFSDAVTALTLFSIILATNAIQYISIDNAQSHAPIFLLYCIILWLTQKWHEKPAFSVAFFAGYVIGLATISRPTEAIMVLIPILWSTHTKEAAAEKWQLVKNNLPMVYVAAIGGIIGILPQLIYWQYVTGFFIYDVGSAWRFLSPFFRVLFGFEKGWFIYTPVTIFFIIGFFYLKNYPFKKAVLWFCMLNIWIIISWSDWKYGGSYATRALMQSYPVFALAFAAFIQKYWLGSNRYLMGVIAAFLIGLNLFQIQQYNKTVLHYYDMNRAYYSEIFMNPKVSALQKSLLDNADWVEDEGAYTKTLLDTIEQAFEYRTGIDTILPLYQKKFDVSQTSFLKVSLQLKGKNGLGGAYLNCVLTTDSEEKKTHVRLSYPEVKYNEFNEYSFYIEKPAHYKEANVVLFLTTNSEIDFECKELKIEGLAKAN